MKRSISILIALFVLIPYLVFAAGSVSQQMLVTGPGRDQAQLIFIWTGHQTTGAVPTTQTDAAITAELQKGWYPYVISTTPSTVAPTSYSVFFFDAEGIDVTGGVAAGRSTTHPQQVALKVDSTNSIYGSRVVTSSLSIAVTNQTTASAGGKVILYLYR
jgi:uncharacterized protein YcfL